MPAPRSPASAPTTSCLTASTPPNTSMPGLRGQGFRSQRERQSLTPGWTRRAACTTRRSRRVRAARFKREAAPSSQIAFTEGRQIEFKQRPTALPGLNGAGQQSDALKALLKGTEMTIDDLYQDLQRRCCEQIAESDFTELDADEPRYEELNRSRRASTFPWAGASTRRSGCRAPRVSTACASAVSPTARWSTRRCCSSTSTSGRPGWSATRCTS